MKALKIVMVVFLSLNILAGVIVAAASVPVYFNNWHMTSNMTSQFSPTITKFSTTLSYPASTNELETNELILINPETQLPQYGKFIAESKNNNGERVIKAYGSNNASNIITAPVQNNIDKIFITIPLLGIFTNTLSNPIAALVYFIMMIGIVIFYYKAFFRAKETHYAEDKQDYLETLDSLIETAPTYPTKKERKLLKATNKND